MALGVVAGALVSGPPAPPVSAAVATAPVGTVEVTGPGTEDCPGGFSCVDVAVTCAEPYATVPAATGTLAIGRFTGARRGVLVTFGGGGGRDFWLAGGGGRTLWKRLAKNGIEEIAVAWHAEWNTGAGGFAALSCRPAAVIEWAAARDAAAGSTPPAGDGVCGVCVIGYSVGSGQAASAVAFHDVGDLVDGVITASGPPNADLLAGCARDGSPLQFLEPEENAMRGRVDDSYDEGAAGPGSCSVLPEDLTAEADWRASSLVDVGRLSFPTTRFDFAWGDADRTGAVGQGMTWLAALADAGTPLLRYACVPAHHDLFATTAGRAALLEAILWTPATGLNVPPVPQPTITPRCTAPAQ
ncbi:MAG TPA: hypothetical protein VGB14_00580 [Acidimicrobiales bacterium]